MSKSERTRLQWRNPGTRQRILDGQVRARAEGKGTHDFGVGECNPSWKGGLIDRGYGYVHELCHGHPHADPQGYVRQHRLVMEKHLGRFLAPEEVVHHIDGDRKNNVIENLRLFPNESEHRRHHLGKGRSGGTDN